MLKRNELEFTELFTATPHVFICDSHPLASKKSITMDDLQDYPYLTYEQGEYNSQYFSEEFVSTLDSRKNIRVRHSVLRSDFRRAEWKEYYIKAT